MQSELLVHIKPEIALNSDGEGPLIACGSYSVMHTIMSIEIEVSWGCFD